MRPEAPNVEHWKKVEELFQATLAEPGEKRADFLQRAAPDDPKLRAEVESLLKARQSGDSMLDGSPLSSVAESQPALKPATNWAASRSRR